MNSAENPVMVTATGHRHGEPPRSPGGFYAIVTGDRATRSVAMERLEAEAQKNPDTLFAHSRRDFARRAARRQALAMAGRSLHQAVVREDHPAIVEREHDAMFALCRLLAGPGLAEDEALGFALCGARGWGWVSGSRRSKEKAVRGTARGRRTPATTSAVSAAGRGAHELWEIHSLLGLYFLATYREEAPDDDA